MQDMDAVYRQHAQTVFKYLMLLTHDADLAEKLAHQHMINAYDNMVKNGLHEAYEEEKNYGQD